MALVYAFDLKLALVASIVQHFNLENGADHMAAWFQDMQVYHYSDALVITDVVALIDFILSASTIFSLNAERKAALSDHLHRHFAAMGGTLHVQKASGLIRAIRRTPWYSSEDVIRLSYIPAKSRASPDTNRH